MFGLGFSESNKTDDEPYLNGSDYLIITVVKWQFLCFNWTQKTIKGIRKLKEGEILNVNNF